MECVKFVQPDDIIRDHFRTWQRWPDPQNLSLRLSMLKMKSDSLAEQNTVAEFEFDFATGDFFEFD